MSLTGTLFINEIYMQAFWLSGQDRTCHNHIFVRENIA